LLKTLRENRPFPRVDVCNGATLLGSFFANTSLFPNTYYFNITAGPGEAITSVVLKFHAFAGAAAWPLAQP
jgi:hypothetical protein